MKFLQMDWEFLCLRVHFYSPPPPSRTGKRVGQKTRIERNPNRLKIQIDWKLVSSRDFGVSGFIYKDFVQLTFFAGWKKPQKKIMQRMTIGKRCSDFSRNNCYWFRTKFFFFSNTSRTLWLSDEFLINSSSDNQSASPL